jgi:hypothetical protein
MFKNNVESFCKDHITITDTRSIENHISLLSPVKFPDNLQDLILHNEGSSINDTSSYGIKEEDSEERQICKSFTKFEIVKINLLNEPTNNNPMLISTSSDNNMDESPSYECKIYYNELNPNSQTNV